MAPTLRPSTRKKKIEDDIPPVSEISAVQLPSSSERQRRGQTPPSFWDNLSHIPLCPRALREINRRAKQRRAALGETDAHHTGTRQGLKRFARHGGPDLSKIRGYPEPTASMPDPSESGQALKRKRGQLPTSSPSPSSDKGNQKRRKTTTYDPAFQTHIEDHGINFRKPDKVVPNEFKQLQDLLKKRRPSLSPSLFGDTEYEAFVRDNADVTSEADVLRSILPAVLGTGKIPSTSGVQFDNLHPLTDGSLADCKPDYYEGSCPADLRKDIRKDLEHYIIPSTNTGRPCLPNFFVELKADGSAAVAKRQACYDGAIGARAMHQLRAYGNEGASLDKKAYTITSTLTSTSGDALLTLYTMHPTDSQDPDRDMDYRMTRLGLYPLTDDIDSFRRGVNALRNAREWAQEQRAEAIRSAHARASAASHSAQPSTEASEDSTP